MKRHSSCLILLPVLLCACAQSPKPASPVFPDSLSREQIAQARQQEAILYDRELRDCYQRFAVNDCRRDALTRHRDVLHALRAIELKLNEQQRQQRIQSLQEPSPAPESGKAP